MANEDVIDTVLKIKKFQIIDHGYFHAQYFDGCGVAFTEYNAVYTGAGSNAIEAYEDAVEQLYSSGEYDGDKLPRNHRWLRKHYGLSKRVPYDIRTQPENGELYWYVSIRVR